MNDRNPYQPPGAPVEDIVTLSGSEPPFFAVSTGKLLLMTLATLGLYELVWFYRQWVVIKRREGSSLWPLPRTIFGPLFSWALFRRIADMQRQQGIGTPLAAGLWAAILILLNAAFRLPDPWWLLNFASVLPLLVAQAAANEVNATVAPNHDRNRRLTPLNWIAIGLFSPAWLLTLVGLLKTLAG